MRRLAIIVGCLMLGLGTAHAQNPDAPVMGSSASEVQDTAPPTDEKRTTDILVLGDAIGGGLGAGLSRVIETGGDFDVTLRFNEESGLARPEVYDWPATLPKMLEGNSYDVVVVMLGANDRQTIRDGNMRYVFGSDQWKEAYGKLVDAMLDQLAASKARIIWVSPPPMKDPEYDAAIRVIGGIQRARVEARGMTYLDIRPSLTADDGSYTDTGEDDTGTTTKLRARDGISFFKAGNNLMGLLVLDAIEKGAPPKPEKTSRLDVPRDGKPAEAAAPKLRQIPIFGQAIMDAEPYMVQPEGVTANAMLLASGGLGSDAALKTLRDLAPKGSDAERLFRSGTPQPAPKGRADDFSAAAAE